MNPPELLSARPERSRAEAPTVPRPASAAPPDEPQGFPCPHAAAGIAAVPLWCSSLCAVGSVTRKE